MTIKKPKFAHKNSLKNYSITKLGFACRAVTIHLFNFENGLFINIISLYACQLEVEILPITLVLAATIPILLFVIVIVAF